MEPEDQDYIEGTKLWIAAQKNLIDSIDHSIAYNRREIELHQAAIDAASAMLRHYQKGVSDAERKVGEYFKDDFNP